MPLCGLHRPWVQLGRSKVLLKQLSSEWLEPWLHHPKYWPAQLSWLGMRCGRTCYWSKKEAVKESYHLYRVEWKGKIFPSNRCQALGALFYQLFMCQVEWRWRPSRNYWHQAEQVKYQSKALYYQFQWNGINRNCSLNPRGRGTVKTQKMTLETGGICKWAKIDGD